MRKILNGKTCWNNQEFHTFPRTEQKIWMLLRCFCTSAASSCLCLYLASNIETKYKHLKFQPWEKYWMTIWWYSGSSKVAVSWQNQPSCQIHFSFLQVQFPKRFSFQPYRKIKTSTGHFDGICNICVGLQLHLNNIERKSNKNDFILYNGDFMAPSLS